MDHESLKPVINFGCEKKEKNWKFERQRGKTKPFSHWGKILYVLRDDKEKLVENENIKMLQKEEMIEGGSQRYWDVA